MNKKYILGGICLVALVLFGVMNLKKSVTPYVGFQEAKQAKTSVQVNGKLVKGSNRFDSGAGKLIFQIDDGKGDTMVVDYPKAAPANFEDSTGMVVSGQYSDGVFHASTILVKCPSKYEKKVPGSSS